MDKTEIIDMLRAHEPELKAAEVAHLFLHGSYARGTMVREASGVDIIAKFDPSRRLSLLDMVAIETVSPICSASASICLQQNP